MSRTDIRNQVAVEQTIAPASQSAGAVTGSGVDLANADKAMAIISIGAVTSTGYSFALEHAEDDGSGSPDTWEAVPSDEIEGDLPDLSQASTVVTVGYHGVRRHLRVTASDDDSGDAIFGAAVLTAGRRVQPTS